MDKKEYTKIMKLLDEGKIDELKQYLDKRMHAKYLENARKAIMSLINGDCFKECPSYYQRVDLHQGILKIYCGIFDKTESGIVLAHKNSNLFELYDEELLNANLEEILKRSNSFDWENKKQKLEIIKTILANLDAQYQREVQSTSKKDKCIEAQSSNENVSVIVPSNYYTIAHQLLGEQVKEYMNDEGKGIYLKSPNGKALIMGMVRKQ